MRALYYVTVIAISSILLTQCHSRHTGRYGGYISRYRKVHFNSRVQWVIDIAKRKVKEEDNAMRLRLLRGIDKNPLDFKTVEPLLFSESPIDVSDIIHKSRTVNWIGKIIRRKGSTLTLRRVLRSREAQSAKISCPFNRTPRCNRKDIYRSFDGSCNNLYHPLLGAGLTPYARELEPCYENGYAYGDDLPRSTSVKGGPLPSSRVISTTVHEAKGNANPESKWSFLFTLWGQFLAHGVTDRAPNKGFKESALECCDQMIETPDQICFIIDVPKGDFFRRFGRECLNFARSAESTDINCEKGMREQLNQASSYIDGASVYGPSEEKTKKLREFSGGLLTMSTPNNLPISSHPNAKAAAQGFAFFAAGDDRVNEYIGLMGIETVWPREHNRIAIILGKINPRWEDERLFQETRKIIIALIQHITYSEYLPFVVGGILLEKFGLTLKSEGYYYGYDYNIDPTVTNLFATAAFRFGHSMVRSKFNLMDTNFHLTSSRALSLQNVFFTPISFLQHEHFLMRGMARDASELCDRLVSKDLVNNLYQTRNGNGADLPAFNIQRGRDHGLKSYNTWRKHFGLSVSRTLSAGEPDGFEDINTETVEKLSRVYGHADDVDIWSGGVSETPIPGAAVGPLFAEIIGRQFQKLRNGDRFWYENGLEGRFTPGQLAEIRKTTFSRVLCNTMAFETIQPKAFSVSTEPGNSVVPCLSIPEMDLKQWTER